MPTDHDRVLQLEEKALYLERDLEALDEVVRSMHAKIDGLVRDLGATRGELKSMLARLDEHGPPTNADLENERPPHYG